MLTDNDILRLYQDTDFSGSFSGVKNLKHFIFTDFGQHISEARLYRILRTLPNYVYQIRPVRRYPTRNYQVDSFGKLMGK
jgi:hypothetical protein